MKSTCALEVISPASSTRPVVQRVSAATRDFGSCARRASRTASETWSATLSGWPSETDSEVNRYSWAMASLLENRGEPPGFFGGVAGSGRSGDALAVLVSGLAAGVAPQVVINSATVGPNYIARCRLRTTPAPTGRADSHRLVALPSFPGNDPGLAGCAASSAGPRS